MAWGVSLLPDMSRHRPGMAARMHWMRWRFRLLHEQPNGYTSAML